MRTNGSHLSGRASSGKIASTGHSGSQAPQSMHSSGSITSIRPISWMQSTGQTSMQDLSFTSMHGSAMMYVTKMPPGVLPRLDPILPDEVGDQIRQRLGKLRAGHHLRVARLARGPQPLWVGMLPESEHRHTREPGQHVLRLRPVDVGDHHVRRRPAGPGHHLVAGCRQHGLDLGPEEQVDAGQLDDHSDSTRWLTQALTTYMRSKNTSSPTPTRSEPQTTR